MPPRGPSLAQRVVAVHEHLREASIEHAFGGAIALAYWTLEPRGTRDIDVNVFVPIKDLDTVLSALPHGVARDAEAVARMRREEQGRLWWDDTPLDLFFSYEQFHDVARRGQRLVPFEGVQIPVLGPVELAVFKALFDRTRDWADIEAMLTAETLDIDAVREHITRLAGADDPRLARLDDAVRRADAEA